MLFDLNSEPHLNAWNVQVCLNEWVKFVINKFSSVEHKGQKIWAMPTLRLINFQYAHSEPKGQNGCNLNRNEYVQTFNVRHSTFELSTKKWLRVMYLVRVTPLVWKKPKIRQVTDPCFKKAVRASTPWFEIFWELERWHKPLNSKKRLQNQKRESNRLIFWFKIERASYT